MRDNGVSFVAYIAGDGQISQQLKQESAQLGLDSVVRFVGHVAGQQKVDYLHVSDVLVIPSIVTQSNDREGLPVVLMEALASGKLVVASDVSGAQEVLDHGINGFLFPEKDIQALSEILQTIATLPPRERTCIAEGAKRAARRFDWADLAPRFKKFLEQSVSPNPHRK